MAKFNSTLLPVVASFRVPFQGPPSAGVIVTAGFDELPQYGKVSIRLMKKYARLHGYTVLLDKLIPVPKAASATVNERYMPWQKVLSLRRAVSTFPKAALYAWLDLDCFLLNMALRLEQLLDKEYIYKDDESSECHVASVPDVFLHYSKHWMIRTFQNVPLDAMVNAGIVVIRNSPAGISTLEQWDEVRTKMPDLWKEFDFNWRSKKDKDPYKGWPGEQGGLWHILTNHLKPRAGACVPSAARSWTLIHNQDKGVVERIKAENVGCSLKWFQQDLTRREGFSVPVIPLLCPSCIMGTG